MDDLTRIDGIGKATAKRLAEAGIETFAQLAAIEDGEDSRAEQLGVRPAWIAEAAGIVAEAATDAAEQKDNQGKPPRPDEQDGSAEARPIPADSGAADPQQDNPRGSSGTAREASSTGGGTTAETLSVGTQSGSPNLSSDTVQESMGVGGAPIAGVSDAPIGGGAEPAVMAQGDVDKLDSLGAGEVLQAAILDAHPRVKAAKQAWEAANPDRWPAAIVVVSSLEGFRRGGQAHTKGETRHLPDAFTVVELEQLLGEPKLKVRFE